MERPLALKRGAPDTEHAADKNYIVPFILDVYQLAKNIHPVPD